MTGPPAHLGRVANPGTLSGLSRARPDPSEFPVIVGDYDVTPAGGRKRHPNGPWEWCSHCQGARHWSGFIVADSAGVRYLIGSECGAKHYNGEHFKIAKRTYRDIETSRTLDRRLFRLRSLSKELMREIEGALHSDLFRAVAAKRIEIEKACPDLVFRLANSVKTGTQLSVPKPARGVRGAGFTTEPIGMVQGGALMFHDVQSKGLAAKAAVARADSLASSDGVTVKAKALRDVTTSLEDFQKSVGDLNRSDRFFDSANVARIEAWSDHLKRVFTVKADGTSFVVAQTGKSARRIEPFAPFDPIELPRCAEVLAPISEAP